LCDIANINKNNSPYDNVARSAAIGQLKSIKQLFAAPAANAEVRAHREHLILLIDDALIRK
jgi:hypothetical protein